MKYTLQPKIAKNH